jgi:ATP-dependent DNA helicase RecQ
MGGSMIEAATNILKSVFGYDRFISLQQDVITSVLSGRDCLAVMPTGGGKSLCYQVPALMMDGLTIVVSPLIALMKDQVEALAQLDVPAVLLNSSLSSDEYRLSVERVRSGAAKLLYVAPETLLRPQMLALLASVPVSCLALDEAHCISEWGHDFRPEYRQLATVRARLPDAVCIALTATATPRVRRDIMDSLGFDESSEFVASFNRENLLIRVLPKEQPLRQVVELLRKYPNDPGIIYCATKKQVDALCAVLGSQGFSVCPYHAGLSYGERDRNQERFVRDEIGVMVATIAFGMGIDKSNIRFILHYDLPKNIESYYQEIGRAGRDGMRAECVLLFSYADIHKVKYHIARKEDREQQAANLQLGFMLKFAESDVCRRIPLLGYFGETYPHEKCNLCDNCLASERVIQDLTIPAQKFLSCVKRTGERFGTMHVIDVLRGSNADKVLRFGHERLSTHGIGRELSPRQWRQVARQLLHQELMVQNAEFGALILTAKAWEVLRGKEAVFGRLDDAQEPAKVPEKPAQGRDAPHDRELFETFRRKRKELADEANVPPYVIFSDKTLAEMAASLPRTSESMLSIHGVGRVKLDRYGSIFLQLIEDYCRDHAIDKDLPEPPSRTPENRGPVRRMRELAVGEGFNAGQTIEALAHDFNVRESRILDYLLSYCREGCSLRAEGFLPRICLSGRELEKVMKAFEAHGPEMLRPVFDALEERVSYEDLRVLRLYYMSLRAAPPPGAQNAGTQAVRQSRELD